MYFFALTGLQCVAAFTGGETLSCSFKFRQLKLSERGALPQQEAKGIAAVKVPQEARKWRSLRDWRDPNLLPRRRVHAAFFATCRPRPKHIVTHPPHTPLPISPSLPRTGEAPPRGLRNRPPSLPRPHFLFSWKGDLAPRGNETRMGWGGSWKRQRDDE